MTSLIIAAGLMTAAASTGTALAAKAALAIRPRVRLQGWADVLEAMADQRIGWSASLIRVSVLLLTVGYLAGVTW